MYEWYLAYRTVWLKSIDMPWMDKDRPMKLRTPFLEKGLNILDTTQLYLFPCNGIWGRHLKSLNYKDTLCDTILDKIQSDKIQRTMYTK